MTDITLAAGPLTVVLRPAWGGRVLRAVHERFGDILVPIETDSFVPDQWPKGGAYPLVPFHNRVSDARFRFQDRSVELPAHPDVAPNALHGFSSRRAWQGAALTDTAAHMQLDHPGDAAWPWRCHAAQDYRLAPDRIDVTVSVSNRDTTPMPAGIGWHPYLPHLAGIDVDAAHFWPTNPDLTPTGEKQPAAGQDGDTRYLSDWSRCDMVLDNGLRLSLSATPELNHIVVYSAPAGYVCVEPVSHLANALARPPRDPGDGMQTLAPGETLSGTVALHVQLPGAPPMAAPGRMPSEVTK
ncbi:aldose epimerase family protein [Frigidibacter sp. ROC022]|uniref:aldose epimerase family protein n=1 Tax=Frigidibacter sp. ROC022 TaxID=2971796 RepID=UPI00215AE006|nr:hypothetical protein [Frigidibacter sp. ROC022]MCR8723513.1 hypothetical protein [Frigidibacter sp. ROC022]